MKKMIRKMQFKMMNVGQVARSVMNSSSGEGFVDSAVFPVQDDYDSMNTIEKMKNQVKNWKFNVTQNMKILFSRTRVILADQSGQGALDQVVSILISMVLGALLLAGLYALFADIILPILQERIMDIFDYAG